MRSVSTYGIILAYIVITSVITFVCFGVDKWKAANHKWRIKEATLIGLCLIGGSPGGLSGMYLFRHKTRKPLFCIGIPLILIIQVVCAVILYTSL